MAAGFAVLTVGLPRDAGLHLCDGRNGKLKTCNQIVEVINLLLIILKNVGNDAGFQICRG